MRATDHTCKQQLAARFFGGHSFRRCDMMVELVLAMLAVDPSVRGVPNTSEVERDGARNISNRIKTRAKTEWWFRVILQDERKNKSTMVAKALKSQVDDS